MNSRARLRIVAPSEQLTGVAPPELERAARSCRGGDATHRGLIFLCATLARRALATAVPPGARVELLTGLDVAEAWARGEQDEKAVRTTRAQCFSAVPIVEKKTVEAVEAAQKHLGPQRKTALDAHALRVVRRYAALGAHYAASAAVLTMDAVTEPPRAAEVAQQVAGARAFQATGLGAARHGEFRAKAWEQAEWEAARGGDGAHGVEALALQIFHEYLGTRWKNYADVEQVAVRDFVEWALRGAG